MQRFRRIAALAMLLAGAAPRPATAAAPESAEAFAAEFRALELDARVARATSLVFERPAGVFALDEGTLTLAKPLGGQVCVAVFEGRGTFLFTPPTEIERRQLQRFFDTRQLRMEFTSAVFVFTDSTEQEWRDGLTFGNAPVSASARTALVEARRWLVHKRTLDVDPVTMLALLERPSAGYFYAHLAPAKGEPVFYRLNPFQNERVELLRTPEDDKQGLWKQYGQETICKFPVFGDAVSAFGDQRPTFTISHAELEARVGGSGDGRFAVAYDATGHGDGARWLSMVLLASMTVDSIRVDGEPVVRPPLRQEVLTPRDIWTLWIRLQRPLAAGETRRVRFWYRGDVFDREGNALVHKSLGDLWRPLPFFVQPATWDLRLRTPHDMQVLASGEKASETREGAWVDSRWVTARPTVGCSFDLSILRGVEIVDHTVRPLRVWFHEDGYAGRIRQTTVERLQAGRGYDDAVSRDVARSLTFFERLLGPAVATSMNVIETPSPVFVGYPGLVHMMKKADQQRPELAYSTDVIRAHEVSHQWWGIGVRPRTYHDWWLAEALANYSAAYYLLAGRGDSRGYLEVLREWRAQVLENKRFLLGKARQAGPIWLGRRTEASGNEGDYDIVVYMKGALVLHMLRVMMLDPQTGDDARFRDMLRDFHERHRGGTAGTEDFRAAAERATGTDLAWFFDQWVYGTDIPTLRLTSATERVGDRWVVKGTLHQDGVPAGFRSRVVLAIEHADGAKTLARVEAVGPATAFELPAAAGPPKRVRVDPGEWSLAEIGEAAGR